MNEPFEIPVSFQNKTIHIPAQLFTTAYSYQIRVVIDNAGINFERDDEGNFRAIASSPDDKNGQKTNPILLQAIAQKLNEILS